MRWCRTLGVVALGALLAPAAAQAATVSVSSDLGVPPAFVFTAAPGEANDVVVTPAVAAFAQGLEPVGRFDLATRNAYTAHDDNAVVHGPSGPFTVFAGVAACQPVGDHEVTCAVAPIAFTVAMVDAGDGADTVAVYGPAVVDTGRGDGAVDHVSCATPGAQVHAGAEDVVGAGCSEVIRT
jgi:hypothetical protein